MNSEQNYTAPNAHLDFLSEEPTIATTAQVKDCTFGRFNEVAAETKMVECSLDDYSYVMERCDVICTSIGKFANIASEVRINPGNHPMEWVSQHHFLYRRRQYLMRESDHQAFFNWRRRQRVTIGHDTWIGHRAIIMPGLTIGNGAVIGSGAVVTHNVPPYAIVAGVPAKIIRYRFPEAIWQAIEKTGWYHWDHKTLKERLDYFYDVRLFLDTYGDSMP